MKALKFLILLAAFAFTHQLSAQNVIINNNTSSSGDADFHFPGCADVNVVYPSFGSGSNPYPCSTSNFDHVTINYLDATCTPPTMFSLALDWAAPSFTHTNCAGNSVVFTLTLVGADFVVDIN